MVSIVKNVVVNRIRYKSNNGCVFSAYVLSNDGEKTDEELNVLLTGKIADSDFRLYEGQRFKVQGREHGGVLVDDGVPRRADRWLCL